MHRRAQKRHQRLTEMGAVAADSNYNYNYNNYNYNYQQQ